MRRYLALSLSALIAFPGCMSYTARPMPVPKTVAMPYSRVENSVTVAVDPYIQPDRQKEVFNDELKGMLPLYLFVENRGDRKLSLNRSTIALEFPDGSQISPIQTETVLQRLGKMASTTSGHCGGSCLRDVGLVLPLLPLIIPLMIPLGLASKRASEAQLADYMEKEFKDVVLSKDASAHGFVFFIQPSGTLWFTKVRLALRFVDEADGSSFVVRVPVSESAFKER
jgi:hypothetical protein